MEGLRLLDEAQRDSGEAAEKNQEEEDDVLLDS
jgi:hypothetical protein